MNVFGGTVSNLQFLAVFRLGPRRAGRMGFRKNA